MQPAEALASCERSLRELLTVAMRAKFGDEWTTKVFTPEQVNRLKEKQVEEQKRRTKRGAVAVPTNLINYTEFTQLTGLVNMYWDLLNGALGDKKETMVLLDRFSGLRNAVAHSRELLPFEEELLSGIAGQIGNRVTMHISGQDPVGEYFPRVEVVRDSLGNGTEASTTITLREGLTVVETPTILRPGDTVTFACRGVDPQGRALRWYLELPGDSMRTDGEAGDSATLTWTVRHHDIAAEATVTVLMTSEGAYHRFASQTDAQVAFRYTVLPRLA